MTTRTILVNVKIIYPKATENVLTHLLFYLADVIIQRQFSGTVAAFETSKSEAAQKANFGLQRKVR